MKNSRRVILFVFCLLIHVISWAQTPDEVDFEQITPIREVVKNGKFEQALISLDSILTLNPTNAYGYQLKGFIYANHKKDFLKAIEYYKKFEKIHPEGALNLANLGKNYIKIDSITKGKTYIKRAYHINPDNEYILLQYAYHVLEDLDEKIKVYEKAILVAKLRIEENEYVHIESLRDLHNNIGYNLYLKKEFLKSAHFLIEGLKYGRENVDHLNNLGNSLQRLNHLDEALIYYDLALKIDPKKSFALNGKANTFLRKKVIDSSCIYWKKTLDSGYKFNPEWKEIWDIEDPVLLISRFCK